MSVKLLENVIDSKAMKVVPKDTILEGREDLVARGLAEPFDPNAKPPKPPEPKITDEEVEDAAQAGQADATEDAEENADEKTSEDSEDAQEPQQALIATYSGGGWYELSDGRKVRRKDLPEDAILAV